jgi:hypothetical protein
MQRKAKQPRQKSKFITVNDSVQKGYRYELSAPLGRGFDAEFNPELTPQQMLALGVFCGKYMTDTQRAGSSAPSFHHPAVIVRSIISVLMLAGRFRIGEKEDGSTPTIREVGFNGIAVTTWVAECQRKTGAKLGAGRPFDVTLRKCA